MLTFFSCLIRRLCGKCRLTIAAVHADPNLPRLPAARHGQQHLQREPSAIARLGHEVHLFCQDRSAQGPEGVTIHVPDIGRVLPVYVADRYEGFAALPCPELDEAALGNYLDANVAAIRSVPPPDLALANHLVMGPVILARGLEGRAPYAVKVHGSALEYTVRPHRERFLPYALEGIRGASGVLVGSRHTAESL